MGKEISNIQIVELGNDFYLKVKNAIKKKETIKRLFFPPYGL